VIDIDADDPTAYGHAFADVYDEWYHDLGDAGLVVAALNQRCPPPRRGLLELGIGTGRLAIPLSEAGWEVTGIDASAEMLRQLGAKRGAQQVACILGDVADPAAWPTDRYDIVLAAFNLVFNITARSRQQQLITLAAEHLTSRGLLVIETDLITPSGTGARHTSPSRVVEGVTIETVIDPLNQLIDGTHRGAGRDRPWRLRYLNTDQLDAMATVAGLELADRTEGWSGATGTSGPPRSYVSFYRLNRR